MLSMIAMHPLSALALLTATCALQAADPTVGLIHSSPNAASGYTLFSPMAATDTFLIRNTGELVNRWRSPYPPGSTPYLLENGNLVRAGNPNDNNTFLIPGGAGLIQKFDWQGNILWEYRIWDATQRAHHEIRPLPNGNILAVVWELKTAEEAVTAGRNPAMLSENSLWPEKIVELQPSSTNAATIVWEWHVWDHLVQDLDPTKTNYGDVATHPELIDINYLAPATPLGERADWLHCNGIDYNPHLDQILLCMPGFGEIWIIDHSTTTAEAASHAGGRSGKGGDLLYRWGNPAAYRSATPDQQTFFWQHASHWITNDRPGAGNILVFNNGNGRPDPLSEGNWSAVIEIQPPVQPDGTYTLNPDGTYPPLLPTWSYSATPRTSLYGDVMSSADRLPNGNTLINIGRPNVMFEIAPDSNEVWRYVNPVGSSGAVNQGEPRPNDNWVFRAMHYPSSHPALQNQNLLSLGTIEGTPDQVFEVQHLVRDPEVHLISWSSTPDATYTINYSPTLQPAEWTQIGEAKALGRITHFYDTDPLRVMGPNGYYRLEQQP
ncbi:MAG: aryl-sulfate sulfotransferase [Limisphaerales bacterium]